MKKILISFLAFAVWMMVNFSCGWLFGDINFDMTSKKNYTLDKASVSAAQSLKQKIDFKLYISDKLSTYKLESYIYAEYVIAILENYQKNNPQYINLQIIPVKAYSAEAKYAEEIGLKTLLYESEPFYFGLQISNGDKSQVIAELVPERRAYLEGDINRILANLTVDEKNIVGIISSEFSPFSENKKNKIWSLFDELSTDYKFVNISKNAQYIPLDVKALIVLNPNELPPLLVYGLDQYLIRGGKLIVFVDPFSEIAQFYKGYPPQSRSNIVPLLQNWGINYDNKQIVGSLSEALKISSEGLAYPLWFFVTDNTGLKLHFRTSGSLSIKPADDVNYEILAVSPKDSGTLATNFLRYSSKRNALEHYENGNQSYILAVRAKGKFTSNYTQGYFYDTEFSEQIPPFEFFAQPESELAVIADSDFVSDDAWALESDENNPVFGTVPYADNAEFILRLLKSMLADNEKLLPDAYPKHIDTSSIITTVSMPIIGQYEQQYAELVLKYNQAKRGIADAKAYAAASDTGSRLKYTQKIKQAEEEAEKLNSELEALKYQQKYEIKHAIDNLIWLNIIIFPVSLLFMFIILSCIVRYYNLKRIK